MFIFGHVGITLDASVLATGLTTTVHESYVRHDATRQPQSSKPRSVRKNLFSISDWIESLGTFMDIRLLIIGSMIPDIIDKPIGIFFFGNGRIFTHSLLVFLIVLILGLFLYLKRKVTGILAISAGMFTHLILDQMWLTPHTLLWPLYGWAFPIGVKTNYIRDWLSELSNSPEIYISETVGLIIILSFAFVLIREKRFTTFLIRGKLK